MIKTQIGIEQFEEMVVSALAKLPKQIKDKLDNVEIVIEEGEGPGGYVLGLYHGVPQSRRGGGYSWVLPDKISIYKGTIEKYSRDEAELGNIVRRVVWHEIAHHFGFTEAQVKRLEEKWLDKK